MTTSTITLNAATTVGDKPLVDTLTTVDGVAAPAGASSQMVKVGFGAASDFKTASQTNPFPTGLIQPDVNTTGTISTTDIVVAAPAGGGALVTGASTAGSFVVAAITGGYTAWVAQVTGLTSGTLYFELSADSTNGSDGNWISVIGRQTGIVNSTLTNNASTNGNWRGNLSGYKFMRLRSVGALTGTPAILIRMSAGVATVFLNGSLPAGSNVTGASNINTALVSATTTLHSANVTTGLTVGVNLPITGYGTTVLKVTGAFVASFAFKISADAGVSWDAISATQIGGGDIFTTATQPGSYRLTVAGLDLLRVEVTLTSGSITITGKSSNAVNASKIVKLATSGLSIGTTPGPALTKGTQGAVGHSTQDLKDAGRVAVSFTAEFSPIAVAEAMLSMSVSKDGATAAATTSYVVTTGKRLRITSISHFVETTLGTSIQRAYLRMRFAATAGAVATSPLQMSIPVAAAGVVKSISTTFEDIPDGLEFLGDGVKAIGFSLQAPDWVTAAATLKVYVTVIGFEY